MKMKKTFKIIGLVISFLGFMALGYFVPMHVYDPIVQLFNNGVTAPAQPKAAPAVAYNNQQSVAEKPVADPVVEEPAVKTQSVDSLPTVEENIVAQVSGVPQNIKAVVSARSTKNYKRLGYPLTVTAEVESGADMECLVKLSEQSADYVAKAMMKDGKVVFGNVPPVDGGAYYICVRNVNSGESAGLIKGGFDKVKKLSKEELTQQLNADNLDKYFYFHFDWDKLKFDCEGVTDGEKPSTIERLRLGRSAFGWTITVSETPKYDKYNRIVYFKVQIAG